MKNFAFPLESLRTLRQQRERAAQQRYAQALVICDGAQRLLRLADEELKTAQAMLTGELTSGTTAARVINLRTWCAVLEARRRECASDLTNAQNAASEAFRAMNTAAREREALDRFHDKSHRIWQRACQVEEQKMFDELAVQRQVFPALEHSRLN
jgi:flagellar export protein FliJ